MKESEWALSRRRFLLASAGIAAGVALAPSVLDVLDRLGPRRLFVPSPKSVVLDSWRECYFHLTDNERLGLLRGEVPLAVREAQRAMEELFLPGMRTPFRLNMTRQYGQEMYTVDAIGADRHRPTYVWGSQGNRANVVRLLADGDESGLHPTERRVMAALRREFA